MSDAKPEPQPHQTEEDAGEQLPRERRARVFKKGRMIFQNGLRSIPCMVRNISGGGALLQFEQAFLLPKEFDLQIDLEDYEVSCVRRWEDGLRCGVQFVGEKRPTSKQRAQVLKSSEEALKPEINERTESFDGAFARKLAMEKPQQSAEPAQRDRPAAPGKPTFGKRR
ncbi:PilZ domain-containing protein [Labrenzia sp. 011]|uniref:PilZ domain-containing protein n=1 Tax=Labrenzia sp. 011 TaxID=2171494 RepID=UPI000D51EF7F|nr:PilZ domain-containing protein [Labrenzia sp. 011]PVB60831.1 PilZ domain-containing protein [Labrenzia sp. 011]